MIDKIIKANVVNPAFPIEKMKFRGQVIDSSVFSGLVEGYDFTDAKFTGDLKATHFKDCILWDTDFTESNMSQSVKFSFIGINNQFLKDNNKPKITDEQSKMLGYNERIR